MGDGTGIEWTDATWNPIRGCSRVSEGCRNCYAEKVAARFSGEGQPYEGLVTIGEKGARWNGSTHVVTEHLSDPLRWRRPRRVFVNSMSDLFHESVSFETIAAIFGVMAGTRHHAFQVLTKRPERAREFFEWLSPSAALDKIACLADEALEPSVGRAVRAHAFATGRGTKTWPLPNVWLGVSVEDQRTADERIPALLELPAALRFVSYEPALGPVDFARYMWPVHASWPATYRSPEGARAAGALVTMNRQRLVHADSRFVDWIIVGGESGPGARPFDVAWARSTIEQCRSAKVACFVKQLGARPIAARHTIASLGGEVAEPLALRHRTGADPLEWPEDLRVREMPA